LNKHYNESTMASVQPSLYKLFLLIKGSLYNVKRPQQVAHFIDTGHE